MAVQASSTSLKLTAQYKTTTGCSAHASFINSLTRLFIVELSRQAINLFSLVNRMINFFNRTLIAVLTHILFVTFFLFVCVPFGGRRRRPIAVER